MHKFICYTILLLFLSFTSFFTSALAQDLSKRPYIMAPFNIEGRELSNVWLYPPAEGMPALVDKAMVLSVISPLMQNKESIERFDTHHPSRFVELSVFEEFGLILFYDQEELLVRGTIRPYVKNLLKVDLLSSPQLSSSHVTGPSFFSGYSNFYFGQRFSRYSAEDSSSFERGPINASADFGVSASKWTLLSRYQFQEGSEKPFVLGATQIVRDFPNSSSRFHFGEFEILTAGHQREIEVGGVMIHKVLASNPSLVSRSNDTRSLILKEDSTIEVMINNSVIHKDRYPAGPVEFSNFPFVGGMNNVILRITDKFGKVETINFSHLYDSDVLQKGSIEFALAQGGVREQDYYGRSKYRNFSGVHSSFFRYGLTDQLTTGINFQKVNSDFLAGTEASWLSPWGVWENHLAISRSENEDDQLTGHAYRFRFRNYDYVEGHLPFLNLRFTGEWMGKSYLYANQNKGSFSLFASKRFDQFLPLSFLQFPALGLGVTYRDSYTIENSYDLRADMSFVIDRNWTFSVNATRRDSMGAGSEFMTSIDLSWSPSNDHHALWASYDSVDQDLSMRYRGKGHYDSLNTRYDAKVGHSVAGKYGQFEAGLSGQRGEINSQLNYSENGNDKSESLNFEGRFALAFAGSHWALGRYVGDSFIIVDTNQSPVNDLSIRQGSGRSPYKIDCFGAALVGDVSPYLYQEFSYDLSSLPERYRLLSEQFAVIPSYRRGSLLTSDIEERISVVANIVDQHGRKISYLSGAVEDSDKKVIGSFFSNKDGRIYIERLPAGKYVLVLDDEQFAPLNIQINVNQLGIVDFGVMTFFDQERK